jgi:hypothetical protein
MVYILELKSIYISSKPRERLFGNKKVKFYFCISYKLALKVKDQKPALLHWST